MSSIEGIITDILKREGSQETNDPHDAGGRTKYGISEKSNPDAWKDGVVTEEEARNIYRRKYIESVGFDKITDAHLRAQLIDFGVNSGPLIAIKKLQEVLHVDADGILGPKTFAALEAARPIDVNNLLAKARILMICRIVQKNPSQLKWLSGWITRACEFLCQS